jgi:cytochrome d ubiquinol oxidase subunit II
MPALYLPVTMMLAGLILRGVAFEFRLHGRTRGRLFWTWAFAGGSLAATVAQGFILGGFIQGVQVSLGRFSGGALDWATPYTLVIALGLVCGYVLLGSAWLMIKSEGELHALARAWVVRAAVLTGVVLATVSIATLFLHPIVAIRWGIGAHEVDIRRFAPLVPIPLMGALGLLMAITGAQAKDGHPHTPLIGGFLCFLSGYLGLAVGFLPFIVPYALTYEETASSPRALKMMLAGTAVLLPLILGYSAWVYWIFRGKVGADGGYHP